MERSDIMQYSFANRVAHLTSSKLRDNAKKVNDKGEVISFAYGYPSTDAFPMDTLRTISAKMYDEYPPDTFLQYSPTEGYAPLRELIKKRLAQYSGIKSDDDVMIVSGSTQGMDLAVKVLCNEGDVVLCEDQTFSGAVKAVQSYGVTALPVPMDLDKESMDLDALEHILQTTPNVKMIYVIPTFQNPLGTSMSLDKRKALYEIAQKYDVLIFEDDPYGELLYTGEPIAKIKSMDTDGRVIYSGSFSKVLAPSTRLGFVMASGELMRKLIVAKQVVDSHSNYYWQVLLAEFIENYDFQSHVEYLKKLYRGKAKAMIDALDKIPSTTLRYIRPTGGYFIGCHMADDIDPERFYDLLSARHVAVIPGDIMSVTGEGYEHDFRLNFTRPSLSEIAEGIAIIGEVLEESRIGADTDGAFDPENYKELSLASARLEPAATAIVQ